MDDARTPLSAHNPHCFACGPSNPAALRFRITGSAPGEIQGEVRFTQQHEGGIGRTHGGVVGAALDEILGQLAIQEVGAECMTAQLNVRFLAPASTGDVCVTEGTVQRREGRKLWLTGRLRRGDTDLASAEGLWLTAKPEAGPAPV